MVDRIKTNHVVVHSVSCTTYSSKTILYTLAYHFELKNIILCFYKKCHLRHVFKNPKQSWEYEKKIHLNELSLQYIGEDSSVLNELLTYMKKSKCVWINLFVGYNNIIISFH